MCIEMLLDYGYILIKVDGVRNLFGVRIADSYGNKELITCRNTQFFSIFCLLFMGFSWYSE